MQVRYGIVGVGDIVLREHLPVLAREPGARVVAIAGPLPDRAARAREILGHQVAACADHTPCWRATTSTRCSWPPRTTCTPASASTCSPRAGTCSSRSPWPPRRMTRCGSSRPPMPAIASCRSATCSATRTCSGGWPRSCTTARSARPGSPGATSSAGPAPLGRSAASVAGSSAASAPDGAGEPTKRGDGGLEPAGPPGPCRRRGDTRAPARVACSRREVLPPLRLVQLVPGWAGPPRRRLRRTSRARARGTGPRHPRAPVHRAGRDRHPDHAVVSLDHGSADGRGARATLQLAPFRHRLEVGVHGEAGMIVAHEGARELVLYREGYDPERTIVRHPDGIEEPVHHGSVQQHREFLAAVRGEAPPWCDARMGLEGLWPAFMAESALAEGRIVRREELS